MKEEENYWDDYSTDDLIGDAKSAMRSLLPPEDFGEDSDAETLYNCIEQLGKRTSQLESERERIRKEIEAIQKDLKYHKEIINKQEVKLREQGHTIQLFESNNKAIKNKIYQKSRVMTDSFGNAIIAITRSDVLSLLSPTKPT